MLLEILLLLVVMWVVLKSRLPKEQAALAKQLTTKIKAYPIIGHTYKFFGTSEDRMEAWKAFGRDAIEAGGISVGKHFDKLIIYVADPAIAEIVLHRCLEKDHFKIANFLVGHATVVAPVPIWRNRRNNVAPAFHMKYLKQFVGIFSEHSIAMADRLEKEVGKGTFSIWEYVSVCNMNATCETTTGIKINSQETEFMHTVEKLWRMGSYFVMCQPWLLNKVVLKTLPGIIASKPKRISYNFITKIYNEKRKQMKEDSIRGDNLSIENKISFLDLQESKVGSPQGFSKEELLGEMLQLIVASYDTSATAFVVLLLARHQDVQDKVYEDLTAVFGNSDRAATYEDLIQLKYLDAVIKETLRLYPTVPVLARAVTRDVTLPSGVTLVKGCDVVVNVWAVHRNPAYWGADADQFRPERFLERSLTHPAAFLGFSYGPRGCLGQRYAMLQMKSTLSTLLRRYRVRVPPGVSQGEPLRTSYYFVMRHTGNYEIQLDHRNKYYG